MKLIGFLSILFTLQAHAFTVDYSRKASEFGVVGISSTKPASGPICQGLVLDTERVIFREGCADQNGMAQPQYLVFGDDLSSSKAIYIKIKTLSPALNAFLKATGVEPFPASYKKWNSKEFFKTASDQDVGAIQKMISVAHFGYTYNQGNAQVIKDYRTKAENISVRQVLLAGSARCGRIRPDQENPNCPDELVLKNKMVSTIITNFGEDRFRLVYYSKGVAFAASTPLFAFNGKSWAPVGESGEYQPLNFIKANMSLADIRAATGFGSSLSEYFVRLSREAIYSSRSGYWINMIFDYKASGL